ncbi:MAG: hypothetical protein OEW18_15200 [Candidatus Aminicenantes bacterium]|nr:hypothetical protein [Candidatus Aminicenantes bacterium]
MVARRRANVRLLSLLTVLLLVLPPPPFLWPGQAAEPESVTYRTYFTVRSAQEDATVPATVRQEISRLRQEKMARERRGDSEEGGVGALSTIALDLNGDGLAEKIATGSGAGSAAGTVWVVYNPRNGRLMGTLTGSIVFVARESDEGWPRLETYMKSAPETAVAFFYVFSGTRYQKTRARALTLPEIDEYFRRKPPLGRELEEFR